LTIARNPISADRQTDRTAQDYIDGKVGCRVRSEPAPHRCSSARHVAPDSGIDLRAVPSDRDADLRSADQKRSSPICARAPAGGPSIGQAFGPVGAEFERVDIIRLHGLKRIAHEQKDGLSSTDRDGHHDQRFREGFGQAAGEADGSVS